MARIEIKGDIVVNELKWIYDFFGYDCTTPSMVKDIMDQRKTGEAVDVYINSGGGHVTAGQEIYSILRGCKEVNIHIEGMACSAASMIACAGHSDISPVGMLMVHNVSGGAEGDYHDMEKAQRELKTMNAAIAQAYVEKSGMSLEDALKLMDKETWLTANQCVELGLVDGITPAQSMQMCASMGLRVTDAMIAQAKAEKEKNETLKNELLDDLDSFGI